LIDNGGESGQARSVQGHVLTVVLGAALSALGCVVMSRVVDSFVDRRSISWLAPFAAAVVAGVLVTRAPDPLVAVALCVFASALVSLCEIDIRVRRLPREISYSAFAISTPLLVASALANDDPRRAAMVLAGSVIFGLVMLGLYAASRGAMGDGDVRVAPLLGAFLGYWSPALVLVALFVASFSAAVVGVGVMALRRTGRATTVAFGPFLAVGTVVAIVLGSSPQWS